MPSTKRKLQQLAKSSAANVVDPFLLKLAQFKHAIWISDLGTKKAISSRARQAVHAGVTSMLAIPVSKHHSFNSPYAIVVLMHADDELLSFPGGVRSYDTDSVCRLTELCSAVVESKQGL